MRLKFRFLLVSAWFALSAASSFADGIFLSVNATPYDNQMRPINSFLTAAASGNGGTSIALVNNWMSDLRNIPYGYQLVWKTPSQVETRQPADCKGKAVTLYHRMRATGATDVRHVIGKRSPTSKMTHAWLEWNTASGSFLLDPTFDYAAVPVEKIAEGCYVPLYAYAGAKKFRVASNLLAQN